MTFGALARTLSAAITTPVPRATRVSSAPYRAPSTKEPRPGQLVIDSVSKRFPGSLTPAVDGVSLTCEPGEFVVLVGPSGCGKTTILNIAAGMVRPDAGSVSLDGCEVTAPGPDRAMVFQEHGLFPWLTAAQNVAFGLRMAGVAKPERAERVSNALRMVHLAHVGGKLPHELSGGMRQRIAIARALVMNPAVLLMDEPFAALDAQNRSLLHEQLQELWLQTRKTVLFVTHSVSEAVLLADRVIVMSANPGRVRRDVRVGVPYPRDPEGRDVAEVAKLIRKEIEDEVTRVNAELAEALRRRRDRQETAGLDDPAAELGGGI